MGNSGPDVPLDLSELLLPWEGAACSGRTAFPSAHHQEAPHESARKLIS